MKSSVSETTPFQSSSKVEIPSRLGGKNDRAVLNWNWHSYVMYFVSKVNIFLFLNLVRLELGLASESIQPL